MDKDSHRIRWPQGSEVQNIAAKFQYGPDFEGLGTPGKLPGVIGALDGKLVVISKPRHSGDRYVDRKSHFSMNLTAVCDDEKRFTFIYAGESGKQGHVNHL